MSMCVYMGDCVNVRVCKCVCVTFLLLGLRDQVSSLNYYLFSDKIHTALD